MDTQTEDRRIIIDQTGAWYRWYKLDCSGSLTGTDFSYPTELVRAIETIDGIEPSYTVVRTHSVEVQLSMPHGHTADMDSAVIALMKKQLGWGNKEDIQVIYEDS